MQGCGDGGVQGTVRVPLLQNSSSNFELQEDEPLKTNAQDDQEDSLGRRVWTESKKLWHIVGPNIFSRVAAYSMNVITQIFAGHLGDLELASMTISLTVIIGFNSGFLLGMATALETLCGQAFGAKKYDVMGIYLQRSWIVLFATAILLLPMYIFTTPILKLLGEPHDVAELSGVLAWWLIPFHLSLAFYLPLLRFLQSQLKTAIIAWVALAAFLLHILMSWVFVNGLGLGAVGAVVALDISWWLLVFGLFGYAFFGGCPLSWTGFSFRAFSGLWEFVKLSTASGVMLCLETWYYKILILMTGTMKNAEIALDALSICQNIDSWEMMIPIAFLGATGVRVANELGAGNGKGAKFATVVSVMTSATIALFFCIVIMIFREQIALFFTSSSLVLAAVDKLIILLGFTILLNSVQPVLSGQGSTDSR